MMNKPFYNFEKIEERWQKKFKKIIAHNGLCMSSGTCIHFQITDTVYVPLLIHGVMCRFLFTI